jgi:hypothetical protein
MVRSLSVAVPSTAMHEAQSDDCSSEDRLRQAVRFAKIELCDRHAETKRCAGCARRPVAGRWKALLDFEQGTSLVAAHELYDTDTARLDLTAIERIAHRRVAVLSPFLGIVLALTL